MEFTKNDLKDGYLVEYKNGRRYLVTTIIDEVDGLKHKVLIMLLSNNDYCIGGCLYNFNDDLTYNNDDKIDDFDDFDIEKVYDYPNRFGDLMDVKSRELLWERKRKENAFMTFQELLDTANKTHETPIKISYKSEKFKEEILNKLKNNEIDDIEKIKIKSLYYLLSGKERVFGEHYDTTFERLIRNIDNDKVVELAIAMSEVFEMLDVPNC